MRAAVDVNCLAAQSGTAYWNLVDYIHAHASKIGEGTAEEKDKAPTLARATAELDKLTREQAVKSKADLPKLDACIAKQDTTAIEASKKIGDALNLQSTAGTVHQRRQDRWRTATGVHLRRCRRSIAC